VFDTSIKFALESVLGSKAKRLARLKDSSDHYLKLRKELGEITEWDERIGIFAHSYAFGDGKLIERQFIDLAEKCEEPEQVLLLHPAISNYLDLSLNNKSSAIKIRPGFATLEKRNRYRKELTVVSSIFITASLASGYFIHQFYVGLSTLSTEIVFYKNVVGLVLSCSLTAMMFCAAFVMLLIHPEKMDALDKFDLLLKNQNLQEQDTELPSDSHKSLEHG
jgi:hypothetical protein